MDAAWRFAYANQAFLDFVGRKPQEVIGQKVWRVFPDEKLLRFGSEARRAVSEKRAVSFVEFAPSLDRWLYTRMHPSAHGLLVSVEDRTEDARTGFINGVAGTDRLLGELQIGYAYAYWIGNEDERVLVWVSDSFEQITGYRPDEIPAVNGWLHVVHPEDRNRVKQMAASLWRGETVDDEYRIIRADGQTRWLADRTRPALDGRGRVVRIHGFTYDITERRERDEAMRREGTMLQSLIAALPLPVVGMDRSGRVTHWNPAAEATFGWTASEVIGGVFPRVPEDRREEHRVLLRDAFEGNGFFRGAEIRRQRKDGSLVDLEIWSAPLPVPHGDGEPEHAIAVLLDITERRALEQQVRESQRMEAIGQLAGGVAHDFNNLLTVIQGRTQMLLDGAKMPEDRSDLEEVRAAAERAALLTRQLLAFSRRQLLQPVVLNLNSVIRDIESMIRRLIGEHIDVVTELDPELGDTKVDPVQMQQVLLNLAVNARDAMTGGGHLTISTANVELDATAVHYHPYAVRTGSYVLLSVADTGTGMDASTQARIFEPFFTTKQPGKGTGLGLSTVYGIVKQSQGYITVESELGIGTTVRIHLPRTGPARHRHEAESNGGPATRNTLKPGIVLLVEDEDGLRRLAAKVLRRAGFQVLEAADCGQALERANGHDGGIQVLLTDVLMPGASGIELARQIQAVRPETRIVYMSGDSQEIVEDADLRPDRAVFLAKPFTPAELVDSVRHLLEADEHPTEAAFPRTDTR
jgi:two-component system cell cycle sensor histidine kinase/response regulator CckA